ncbi:hypothetical protein QVD17_38835 [Tagetes erecta]|uniref:Uncharacterized protein n=1 Tax=Tagetes erecta TaxID=13708 RepID=A0AAD8NGJ8_TARER|nr:hypothetical protein QVD17_38835 [Tagetes erecta]
MRFVLPKPLKNANECVMKKTSVLILLTRVSKLRYEGLEVIRNWLQKMLKICTKMIPKSFEEGENQNPSTKPDPWRKVTKQYI